MRNLIRSLAALLSLLPAIPAAAQTPAWPQNIAANSVVGRLGIGTGPAQAIPFSYFAQAIFSGANTLPNSTLAQAAGVTLKGNPTASIANVQDFTISGLTAKSSPVVTDMLLLWDSASGTFKKLAAGSLPAIAANTFLANTTGSLAQPIATAIPSCATDGLRGLTYTSGSGFNCTAISIPTSSYPDFWNGSFSVWQRATVFSFTGGTQTPNYGQYTADYTSNGAGNGGVATVQKYVLNTIEQAAITPSINPPSTGMRMTFSTAPTSGEGVAGYPSYASYIELKGNNVPNYAGKEVTVSAWIRGPTSAQYAIYLYVALGGLTNTNSSVNTISGTGAGCDYAHAGATEIFCRSAQTTTAVGPTWSRISYTLTLDNLQAATFTAANTVVNIGIGMDYTNIGAGEDIYITALNLDPGPTAQPWREWPDEMKYAFAAYNFQYVGVGAVGFATSTTAIKVSLPLKGIIKANGSGGGGLFITPSTNPIIKCSNGSTFTGSGSAFTVDSASANGLNVNITGFTGLTSGNTCILTNDWLYSAQG